MKSRGSRTPSKGQTDEREAPKGPAAGAWQRSRAGRPAVSAETIAKRAYEKWQRRGGSHGDDQRDWFEAERELWAEAGRSRN